MKKRILLVLPLALLPLAVYAEGEKPMQGVIEHHEPMAVPFEPAASYPTPRYVQDKAPPERTIIKKPSATIKGDPKKDKTNTIKGNVSTQKTPSKGYLPPQFLGVWQVNGSRNAIEAQPQFQAGVSNIFSATTSNTWRIQGNKSKGYILSTDTGVQTQLTVESRDDTAILRYQHPINKTIAQEALVMKLLPGGAQFDGLESISIVKPNEPPRAKVTYKLIGRRQN